MRQARALILDDENLGRLVTQVNQELEARRGEVGEKLDQLNRSLADRRGRLERLLDAVETGALELQDVTSRLQGRRREIAEIEQEVAQVRASAAQGVWDEVSLEQVREYALRLRETLRIGSLRDRKKFLVGLIQQITVGPGTVDIEYRLPIEEETRTEDLISSVLESVASGGGGGSRTRVRSYRRSASTSLDPCTGFRTDPPAGRMIRA